jgi:HK97 family phage major capsid protein
MATKPRVTQKLLEDASFDPQAWIAAKVGDKFARTENTAFTIGDGNGKPKGFMTYPVGTSKNTKWGTIEQLNLGSANTLNADGMIAVQFALKAQYRQNAMWGFTRTTHGAVRTLKDQQGRYYWQPNYEMGLPPTLLGSPIIELNDMPEVAAGNLAVIYAQWSEFYTIVDRVGISVLVDPYTVKPYTEFYTRKRVGGDVTNFEAAKFGKISA